MTVNISPAVTWREVDQTVTTPGISPSTGAFVVISFGVLLMTLLK